MKKTLLFGLVLTTLLFAGCKGNVDDESQGNNSSNQQQNNQQSGNQNGSTSSITKENVLGAWELTIPNGSSNIPVRYTFNADNTCTANTLKMFDNNSAALLYTFKGTYSISNNKITAVFDNTQFSISNGKYWHSFGWNYKITDIIVKNGVQTEKIYDINQIYHSNMTGKETDCFNAINVLNNVDVTLSNGKPVFIFNSNTVQLNSPAAANSEMYGLWEYEDTDGSTQTTIRALFNTNNTFEMGQKQVKTNGPSYDYKKGSYAIVLGYYQSFMEKNSSDFSTWTDCSDAFKEYSCVAATPTTLLPDANGKLNGMYSKITGTTVKW